MPRPGPPASLMQRFLIFILDLPLPPTIRLICLIVFRSASQDDFPLLLKVAPHLCHLFRGAPPRPFRLGFVPSLYGQIGQPFLMQFLTASLGSGAQSRHFSLMGRRSDLGP